MLYNIPDHDKTLFNIVYESLKFYDFYTIMHTYFNHRLFGLIYDNNYS